MSRGARGLEGWTVIDATGLVLGRMASIVAKRLLMGERIAIINAEKAVISGKKKAIVNRYKDRLQIGHYRKGPYWPRRPDQIIRRTIRGMLPRYKEKGKKALKRLKVFIGVPEELQGMEAQTIPEASSSKLRCPYITLGELAREIGWRPPGEA
ncbi:MAG TPA: 50S ribosomal protein L13 [Candidatus Bathyarchaeota archaeon]|nr:50S ribosomal protein L13 [Candidatus Bathyarchaeota archaeon]